MSSFEQQAQHRTLAVELEVSHAAVVGEHEEKVAVVEGKAKELAVALADSEAAHVRQRELHNDSMQAVHESLSAVRVGACGRAGVGRTTPVRLAHHSAQRAARSAQRARPRPADCHRRPAPACNPRTPPPPAPPPALLRRRRIARS